MRQIRDRKARPRMGHMSVGAEVGVEVSLALRSARFLWASAVRLVSDARAPVAILLRQAGRSWTSDSQELRLMLWALRDTSVPRLSACPGTVLHTAAVLAVDWQTAHLA